MSWRKCSWFLDARAGLATGPQTATASRRASAGRAEDLRSRHILVAHARNEPAEPELTAFLNPRKPTIIFFESSPFLDRRLTDVPPESGSRACDNTPLPSSGSDLAHPLRRQSQTCHPG